MFFSAEYSSLECMLNCLIHYTTPTDSCLLWDWDKDIWEKGQEGKKD